MSKWIRPYRPDLNKKPVQWSINNWKPRFDVDATVNPGGDGVIIFVGLAPPPPLKF